MAATEDFSEHYKIKQCILSVLLFTVACLEACIRAHIFL